MAPEDPRVSDLVTATRSDKAATSLEDALGEIVDLVPVAATSINRAVGR
jgi:hypothetical protein